MRNDNDTNYVPLVEGNDNEDRSNSYGRISNYPMPKDSEEDIQTLKDMGFDSKMVLKVYIFLKPTNIEEAIEIMTEVDGIYQHDFYESRHSNLEKCFLCGQPKSKHHNAQNFWNDENNLLVNLAGNRRSRDSNNIHGDAGNAADQPADSLLIDIRNNNNDNNNSYEDDVHSDNNDNFGNKCLICEGDLTPEDIEINKDQQCHHLCCENCWYEYLKGAIEQAKVANVHCFSYKCEKIVKEDFILKIIKNEPKLIEKYELFKKKAEIIASKTKKFCPSPNCPGYLERKEGEDKYVSCEKGHKYCFVCLKQWHGTSKCDEEVDKDFQLWKKGKVIKQCPNCKFWTEKNEGCNHMTCAECKYQWCWLCEGKYSANHFSVGDCKGLQFSKRNYLNQNNCCRRVCRCCYCEDNEQPCLDDCMEEPLQFFCEGNKIAGYFFVLTVIFLFSIFIPVIGGYILILEETRLSDKCKGFMNFLTLMFGITTYVYFQIPLTCLLIAYTVLTVFYPPINTFYLLKEFIDDEYF